MKADNDSYQHCKVSYIISKSNIDIELFKSESSLSIEIEPTIGLKKWNFATCQIVLYSRIVWLCANYKIYQLSLSKIKFRWLDTYMKVIDSGLYYQLVGMDVLMWANLLICY